MSGDGDRSREEKIRELVLASQRMVCSMLGHVWRQVQPKPDTAMAAIIGVHTICIRCGKLNR